MNAHSVDLDQTWFYLLRPAYPNEPPHDKTNKMACAPSEDSDQPGNLPSLIRLRCALNGLLRTQAFFMRTAKTLIRLGGRPGWSESSLGAQSFCWFCHEAAQMIRMFTVIYSKTGKVGIWWNDNFLQISIKTDLWVLIRIASTSP